MEIGLSDEQAPAPRAGPDPFQFDGAPVSAPGRLRFAPDRNLGPTGQTLGGLRRHGPTGWKILPEGKIRHPREPPRGPRAPRRSRQTPLGLRLGNERKGPRTPPLPGTKALPPWTASPLARRVNEEFTPWALHSLSCTLPDRRGGAARIAPLGPRGVVPARNGFLHGLLGEETAGSTMRLRIRPLGAYPRPN